MSVTINAPRAGRLEIGKRTAGEAALSGDEFITKAQLDTAYAELDAKPNLEVAVNAEAMTTGLVDLRLTAGGNLELTSSMIDADSMGIEISNADEIAARSAADTVLAGEIIDEATARAAADALLLLKSEFTNRSKGYLHLRGAITWTGTTLSCNALFSPVGPQGRFFYKNIVSLLVGDYAYVYARPTDAEILSTADTEFTPLVAFIVGFFPDKNDLIVGYRDSITNRFYFSNGLTMDAGSTIYLGANIKAENVTVADPMGYFTGTNVETALEEVGQKLDEIDFEFEFADTTARTIYMPRACTLSSYNALGTGITATFQKNGGAVTALPITFAQGDTITVTPSAAGAVLVEGTKV